MLYVLLHFCALLCKHFQYAPSLTCFVTQVYHVLCGVYTMYNSPQYDASYIVHFCTVHALSLCSLHDIVQKALQSFESTPTCHRCCRKPLSTIMMSCVLLHWKAQRAKIVQCTLLHKQSATCALVGQGGSRSYFPCTQTR